MQQQLAKTKILKSEFSFKSIPNHCTHSKMHTTCCSNNGAYLQSKRKKEIMQQKEEKKTLPLTIVLDAYLDFGVEVDLATLPCY